MKANSSAGWKAVGSGGSNACPPRISDPPICHKRSSVSRNPRVDHRMVDTEQGRLTMNQPQQHYDVTDDDFDFIWKNIDSPLVVRDRINLIKTRSHPYQSEREKMLDEVLQLPQRREQPNGSMYIYVNDVKELRQKAGD